MSNGFALGDFLARWAPAARHDLAASDSETLTLDALLAMAGVDDLQRWQRLGLGYPDPRGARWLRTAVAARYATLQAGDVLCCAGAQEAVTCVARALLGPDDHAVIVLPFYQPAEHAVTSICTATGVALREEDGWRLDVDQVAASLRATTRLVLLNSPNSPTGAAVDPHTMSALTALCRRHGLWLVVDEVYRQTHLRAHALAPPAADLYERGVSINGLSKGFGLPGLRVGWAACRDRSLVARALVAKSMLSSCVSGASEVLAHVALAAEPAITGRNRATGLANLERLGRVLRRHPDILADERVANLAFAFPRVVGLESADRLAARLIREAGLLMLPASLWHSPLATLPVDRIRISLGHARVWSALDVLDECLHACRDGIRAA